MHCKLLHHLYLTAPSFKKMGKKDLNTVKEHFRFIVGMLPQSHLLLSTLNIISETTRVKPEKLVVWTILLNYPNMNQQWAYRLLLSIGKLSFYYPGTGNQ